jgi:hypothetical protein
MIKRVTVVCSVLVGSLGLVGASASADEPVASEFTEILDGVNPCTGEFQTVTIHNLVEDHLDHPNNFVRIVSRTGSTSDGYVMVSGHVHYDVNRNGEHFVITDTWVNPDTGDRYRVNVLAVFNARQGGLKVDSFRLQCLGAETVPAG